MKTVLFILVIFLAINSESYGQKKMQLSTVKADSIKTDSLEYRLLVFDPGFDAWLAMKPPKEFYQKSFYELKNRLYVSEWNQRYLNSRNSSLYETFIDYNLNTDYGLDFNYRLYYYFRYFEETNHLKLIPGSR